MTSRPAITRRQFNKLSAAVISSATLPAGCSDGAPHTGYEALVASTWRHTGASVRQGPALLRELVRYGTLAPNSHNTQPWLFQIQNRRITIRPDMSRRCPAVDPDNHHVYATLGCAAENIVVAAKANGLAAIVSVADDDESAIRIDLDATAPADSPRYRAITERQCTRAEYDGKPVPSDELDLLEKAARSDGTDARLFTARADLEQILEYVVAGNSAQMNDDAFVDELRHWIRFNESDAVRHRDGLFSASSGNPTVPTWIGRLGFGLFFKEDTENDKYRRHILSSAGVIAFIADQDTKQGWIEAGRSYQRFALQATASGLKNAFVNQAVEVPEVRTQFSDYLGIGGQRPNLLVRFGYGPELPRSLRRPVDQVLV